MSDFCRCCGANRPPIPGEGTCPECDPEHCERGWINFTYVYEHPVSVEVSVVERYNDGHDDLVVVLVPNMNGQGTFSCLCYTSQLFETEDEAKNALEQRDLENRE